MHFKETFKHFKLEIWAQSDQKWENVKICELNP